MTMIETENLAKSFGHKQVLTDINLNVQAGDIYGFLGLNGARKSTTMRLLLKMIQPTKGTIFLDGQNTDTLPAIFWNQVGYLIETPHAYPNFTVPENLTMYAQQRLIPAKEIAPRIKALAVQLLLTPYLDVKTKALSLGNNQKIGLAKALIHHPRILLLDEPTNGLDPESLVAVRRLLKQQAKQGTTILISSHLLGEMEAMVNRIGILTQGQLVRELSFDQFEQERHTQLAIDGVSKDSQLAAFLTEKGLRTTYQQQELVVSGVPQNDYGTLLHAIESQGFRPTSFKPLAENLEAFFLRQIGDDQHVVHD
ncbi:ABC transporter ATP-binding protein [Agrilactobacillus composti]|nr:ABC transporter ATP-binding protein [Agrilactobacillus composti]